MGSLMSIGRVNKIVGNLICAIAFSARLFERNVQMLSSRPRIDATQIYQTVYASD